MEKTSLNTVIQDLVVITNHTRLETHHGWHTEKTSLNAVIQDLVVAVVVVVSPRGSGWALLSPGQGT